MDNKKRCEETPPHRNRAPRVMLQELLSTPPTNPFKSQRFTKQRYKIFFSSNVKILWILHIWHLIENKPVFIHCLFLRSSLKREVKQALISFKNDFTKYTHRFCNFSLLFLICLYIYSLVDIVQVHFSSANTLLWVLLFKKLTKQG